MLEIAAYATAAVAQTGTAFLLLPLLTRTLGPGEFGRWSLLEPLLLYASPIALLGANYGIIKLIGKDGLGPRDAVLRLLPFASMAILFAATAGGILAGRWATDSLLGTGVAFAIAAESSFLIALAALRGANATWKYAFGISAKSALLLCGTLLILLNDGPSSNSVTVVVWLYAFGSLLGVIAAAAGLARHRHPNAIMDNNTRLQSFALYRSAVFFGAPILGSVLLGSVLFVGDRYFLNLSFSHADVAAYVVQTKLANAINLFALPLGTWFFLARFQRINDKDGGERFFSLIALASLGAYLGLASALWLVMPRLLPWLTPGIAFQPVVSGLLAFAAVAVAMSTPLNVGLYTQGRTHWLVAIAAASAIVQIAGLLVLIPIFGIAGAAGATTFSQVANVALLHWGSQKSHPLRWPYGRFATLVTGACCLFLTSATIHTIAWWVYLLLYCILFLLVWTLPRLQGRVRRLKFFKFNNPDTMFGK